MTEDHLDLDALADQLADPGSAPGHLASCAGCAGRLDELAAAQAPVQAALAGLAAPALPEDVAARLDTDLAVLADLDVAAGQRRSAAAPVPGRKEGGGAAETPGEVTTLPVRSARPALPRWLAAAAAVAVVLGGVGTALTVQRDRVPATTGAADASGQAATARNETGTDYADRAALAAAVADLITGTASPAAASLSAETRALPAPAAAGAPAPGGTAPEVATKDSAGTAGGGQAAADAPGDPLATVRTDAGLADCLRAVLPPDDPSLRPLALDYGSYRGTPALVVVLPGASRESLDVFVVGAGCRADNDALLFYASVPAP